MGASHLEVKVLALLPPFMPHRLNADHNAAQQTRFYAPGSRHMLHIVGASARAVWVESTLKPWRS